MFSVNHIEQKAATASTYGGGAGAVVSGLTLNEAGVIVGIVVAVAGLAAQLYFGIRRDRRERELHERKMDTKSDEKAS